MAGDGSTYQSEDQKYGAMLSNLLNPPDEGTDKSQMLAQAATGSPAPSATPKPQPPVGPRPAAAALAQAQTAAPSASPAPATPAGVAPTGTAPAGGQPQQKTWADYVRQSNDQSLQSLTRAQQAADTLQTQTSAAERNAPIEQRRQSLATPIPYRDPTTGKVLDSAVDPVTGETIDPAKLYKPSFGTKVARVLAPGIVGKGPINRPNSNYEAAEASRQAQAGLLSQQEQTNLANEKADSDRLGKIGTEQRAVATGYQDVAKAATAQQGAEQKADYNKEIADMRQQLADQGGVPKTYEQAVIASNDPKLTPAERQRYKQSAATIAATEVKKFQYANKAVGEDDPRRQPLIDAATAQIQKLDDYQWDPEANDGAGGFYDPSAPNKVYSAREFTDMKNVISTKLDKDLTTKKLRPLGVRFDVKSTTPGAAAQPSAQPAAQPAAAPAQVAPKSAAEVQKGQTYNGYKYLGGDKAQKASWQKVTQ